MDNGPTNVNPRYGGMYTDGGLDEEFGQRTVFPLPRDQPVSSSQSARGQGTGYTPLNAMEYLLQVRQEAEIRPVVVAAPQKVPARISRPAKRTALAQVAVPAGRRRLTSYEDDGEEEEISSKFVKTNKENNEDTESLKSEWQRLFLDDYLRKKRQFLIFISSHKPNTQIPDRTAVEWRAFMSATGPSAGLVASMGVAKALRLLVLFKKWLSASMNTAMNQWLYALLLRLPETLVGEDIPILRDLCRKALTVRKKLNSDSSAEISFTVDAVVLVVTRVYGQRDLLDPLVD